MELVAEQNFRIVGTGSYLPKQVVTAEEMDRRVRRESGWCRSHVGVVNRYECVAPETMVTMASEAIRLAMEQAQIGWDAIRVIIDCSTSQFRPIPCNAAHYQHYFGELASGIPCFDIQSTCLGSIVALNLVNGWFGSGLEGHVLLVASETGMGGTNPDQPESACLIGDGAAAVVLRGEKSNTKIVYAHETYSQFIDLCHVEGGGHKLPVFEYAEARKKEYLFSMDGPRVFRVAFRHLPPMVSSLLTLWRTQEPDLNTELLQYVPHQASPRALEVVHALLKVETERFHIAVDKIGNLVAASIPFMLDRVRRQGLVSKGDRVLLLGTSAGYSQAALGFEL
jgi:3-oxoacyl-[acyl-carrier-protein] synthase III